MTKEKALAYAEVYQIIQYLLEEEYKLIPKEKINYIKNNMDKNLKKICTIDTSIDDIDLSDEASNILLSLFYSDVANDKQKRQLEAFLLKKEQENLKQFDEKGFFASKNAYANSDKVTDQSIIGENEFNSASVVSQNTSGENDLNNFCLKTEEINEKQLITINENSWNYKIKKIINKILEKIRIKKK